MYFRTIRTSSKYFLTFCHMTYLTGRFIYISSLFFSKTAGYGKYSPELRCTVAKYAIDHGKRPASKKFDIPESTVRGFVESYKRTRQENPNTELVIVPKKKRGRPTLLPEELDLKVMAMIKSMRESGAVINYSVMEAVAIGIITANDRTLLAANGGHIKLGLKWCESLTTRLNFVKRKATTAKPLIAPGLIKEVGLSFYKEINEIVHAHKIPPELIINIDQTPLPFVLISKYTLEKKGTSRVPVLGTSDYRQITGTFGITLSGHFLPIQLIYQGKTDRSQPNFEFPKEFHVTQTSNHWADENTSIEMMKKILIPYVKEKRKELKVPNKPWLLICDVFKGQWTDAVKKVVKASNGKMVAVPNNWTNYFQPLDLTVNKSSKDFLRDEAQAWYSNEIAKQMSEGKRTDQIKVDVRLSVVKPLHAKWITKYYDYARNHPEIIINGWKKSGITENLEKKINLDPFSTK